MKYEIEKLFKLVNYKYSEEELDSTLSFFSKSRDEVRMQFDNLSWNADKESQECAIQYLAKNLLPCEYILLVFADKHNINPYNPLEKYYKFNEGKSLWENAAKTIIKIGWPQIDNILIPLFMWIIDPNWPGSLLINDFLMTLPETVFISKVKEILSNSQDYDPCIYTELKEAIEEMCDVMKIVI